MYDPFGEPTVVVGEETYWRAWVVIRRRSSGWRLRSIYTKFIYENKPFYGLSPFQGQPYGVYAVFTKEQARRVRPVYRVKYIVLAFTLIEGLFVLAPLFEINLVNLLGFGFFGLLMCVLFQCGVFMVNEGYIAIGQIAAWGDVVKHERGVRVEYARVISIYKVYGAPWGLGWCIKRQLRKYYCNPERRS